MTRQVRGMLFVDYVRMIRGRKDVDWMPYLDGADLAYLSQPIDPTGWYPMETFERLGVAILKEIAHGQQEGVRMWGRFQVMSSQRQFPELVAAGSPRETIMRFRTLSRGFFDYDAVEILDVEDEEATVSIAYRMGALAEETACNQSFGFFEGLVEAGGGKETRAAFTACSWKGAPRTLIRLQWVNP
jgi:hypothetical protein